MLVELGVDVMQADKPSSGVPDSQPVSSSMAAAEDSQAREKQEPQVRWQADTQPQVRLVVSKAVTLQVGWRGHALPLMAQACHHLRC